MYKIYFLLAAIVWSFTGLNAQENKLKVHKLWESANNLTTCESVYLDAPSHIIYVSCINGNPTDKDGNGFIAKLSESGEVVHLHWAEGLDAPKGLGIYDGNLYVTDIDQVVKIDLATAKIIKTYPVSGAKFLNDISISKDGNVYISDMATNIIHWIHKDVIGPLLNDPSVVGPNGLHVENDELLIGTRNGILSLRTEDKRLWKLVANEGGIDGLEPDGKGHYIISDWAGKVQQISPHAEPILIFDTSEEGINAADIQFIPSMNLLLVPTFSANRVDAYSVEFEE